MTRHLTLCEPMEKKVAALIFPELTATQQQGDSKADLWEKI